MPRQKRSGLLPTDQRARRIRFADIVRRRSLGRVALYGLGKVPKQKRAPAAKPRREKSDTRDALGATVRDLKLRREALMADVSKLDRAIEAVEALAA